MRTRARRLAGGILLIMTAQYFVAELVTAAAWTRVPYSFVANYISDLGVPECETLPERIVCSPAHAVMNTGFVLQGVLLVGATWLLARELPRGWRWIVGILGHVFAVGTAIVGLFPGSIAEELGGDPARSAMHGLGALLAIGGGALLVTATSIALVAAGRWRVGAIIGALAAADWLGIVLFLQQDAATIGATERLAVWPTTIAFVVLGVSTLVLRSRDESVA
ncbi:DUF998 domain-containing protein [Agrococcus sp. Marseille-P2731]|uniref:DUF998 domain-containing protein n=1 Tax=Agrococcus sp. Marseille-P2731 TaxID=1841862 RepID=UPI000930BE3F|nr:DUF998 domain-containing protein [Agrococcus sp. Marseille-P2731]